MSRACRTPRSSRKSAASASPTRPAASTSRSRTSIRTARVLLVTTTTGPYANIYDMDKFIAGDKDFLVGKIPVPRGRRTGGATRGYHDFYIAYDPADAPGQVLRRRRRRLLRVRHHEPGSAAAPVRSRASRASRAATRSRRSARPLRRHRDRIPVRAAAHLRPEAQGRRHELRRQHQPPDRRVDRELEEPRPQPRSALAVRVRLGLRGRPAGLQHDGPDESR